MKNWTTFYSCVFISLISSQILLLFYTFIYHVFLDVVSGMSSFSLHLLSNLTIADISFWNIH